MRRWARYSTRSLLVVLTIVAVALGWRMSHVHMANRAQQLLTEAGIYFDIDDSGAERWYSVPALTPRYVESIDLPGQIEATPELRTAVRLLNRLGTVREASIDGYPIDGSPFRIIGQLHSMRAVYVRGAILSAETVRPLANLPRLEIFECVGSTGHCDKAVLEAILSIPSIREVGLPQGESEVPDDLRRLRPDVTYAITDFPP